MTGLNGAYQCINIAVLAGVTRILLLGIDMHGRHWHPEHPLPTAPSEYARCIRHFDQLAPLLAAAGVEVINCSPASALRCFAKADIESLAAHS